MQPESTKTVSMKQAAEEENVNPTRIAATNKKQISKYGKKQTVK